PTPSLSSRRSTSADHERTAHRCRGHPGPQQSEQRPAGDIRRSPSAQYCGPGRLHPGRGRVVDHGTTLGRRIATHTARITIMGQGYVGLPLAIEFAKAGFTVTGLDTDLERVTALAIGRSHVP